MKVGDRVITKIGHGKIIAIKHTNVPKTVLGIEFDNYVGGMTIEGGKTGCCMWEDFRDVKKEK